MLTTPYHSNGTDHKWKGQEAPDPNIFKLLRRMKISIALIHASSLSERSMHMGCLGEEIDAHEISEQRNRCT